jgi:two-component system, OmpR family, response regulator
MYSETARILIVDDDRENGEFLQEQLSNQICKAVWKKDPRQALNQFRKNQYHIALLDLKMPLMNGIDLLGKLRQKDPDLGFIVLTGYPSIESALTSLKTGAFDYVQKPYKIHELKKIVERLLEEKGFFVGAEKVINERIGLRIKEFRQRRSWTITKLALRTHLSKSLISQIENAKNSASIFSLSKIARSLNVRLGDIVQDL